jgi:hypothetical protein
MSKSKTEKKRRIYEEIIATAIHTVKSENIAALLGGSWIVAMKASLETMTMFV